MPNTLSITPVTVLTSGMAVPAIALEVLPYGLHITKILLNADGRSNDVIIAPFSARELVSDRRMMNSVVGRYTNRLPVGKYEIEKGGVTATVTPIANSRLPHVSLHSGPEGFDRKNWTRVATNKAKNFSSAEKVLLGKLDDESVAIFSLISEDGDAGFPGTLYTEVAFAVLPVPEEKIRKTGDIELGSLAIVYRARLLPGGATITPINLTHHWGFNFSASLDPKTEPDANQHWLRADSSKRLELGPDLMPTGEYSQNELDTEWDWKSGKLIGEKPLPRLDGFLVFDRPRAEQQPVHVPLSQWENGNLLQEALDEKREKAYVPIELYEEASGVRAEFITNQPGVQLYGGEGLQGQGTKKAIHGGKADGSGYTGRPGVFLEFHEPVNALFSEFGKEEGADTILSSGEMYNNYVNVVFCYQPRP